MKTISFIILVIFMSWDFSPANAGGVIVHKVIDIEMGARVVTNDHTNLVCLLTPEGQGFTQTPKKWTGFTCAELGIEPIVWKFCRGDKKKLLLLCVTPDTVVNGKLEDADPGNEPKTRMRAF